MPQKTDAVIAELMDRRLLNDVDPDLHQEIAKAVVKAVHTASLQGEDVVERVKALAHRFWSIHPSTIAAMNLTREEFYAREMMALLATGLVPDEAAIRADWHTTGWDRARNSGRILLVWREFAGVREHVELGRYSDSKTAWVNTYGHPFHAEPDGWAPLLPFKTAEAIRADEREKMQAEIDRLNSILNTPILEPFAEAVAAEARHQIYRWGEGHDAKKTAWDWFWTLGHLSSKAAHSALAGDFEKAKHHTVTAAAMLSNWHRHICAAAIRSGGGSNV